MINFKSFQGTVTMIGDYYATLNVEEGCYKLITLENGSGEVANFVASPATYFVDNEMVLIGDRLTGYSDGNAPVPAIYPPLLHALVMVKESSYQNVKVDYFNENLESSDGKLRLMLSPYTQIVLTNGQLFSRFPGKRDLIVIYGAATKSIPAQTAPYRIVVLCY